jgi:hypothetical protein
LTSRNLPRIHQSNTLFTQSCDTPSHQKECARTTLRQTPSCSSYFYKASERPKVRLRPATLHANHNSQRSYLHQNKWRRQHADQKKGDRNRSCSKEWPPRQRSHLYSPAAISNSSDTFTDTYCALRSMLLDSRANASSFRLQST